jgi:hypothetical protein
MIELTVEEYAQLLWCAIHDDRKLPSATRDSLLTRHWEELPQIWKSRFNGRERISKLDITGAEVRRHDSHRTTGQRNCP